VGIVAVVFTVNGVAQAKPTNPKITLGQSIGDVSVGMTRARVERILGHGLVMGHTGVRVEIWSKSGLSFFFKGSSPAAKTIGGVTNNPGYATPQHIRYGSTTATVEAAYPSLNCKASDAPTAENPWKFCTRNGPSGRATIFYFDTEGEVVRIAVGVSSLASLLSA
jgi:hypothetical protein